MTRSIMMAALALCAIAPPSRAWAQAAVGDMAPVLSVPDLDGRLVRLAPGPSRQAMVLEFWATWCEVCEALLPRVREAQAKYANQVDFYGINVTVNESKNRVRRFVAEHRLPFRTLYDERGAAVRAFAAPVTSYVVIVDAKGTIRYIGSGSAQDITKELDRVVRQ